MNNAERRRLKLRLLMRQEDMTAVDVASVVGMQPQTVRMWMCGLRGTPQWIFKRLRTYLRSRPRQRAAA